MSWYLRSSSDYDTHRGELRPDGTVAARCGIEFVPKPLPYDRVALPGHPQDRDQICRTCQPTTPSAVRERSGGAQ